MQESGTSELILRNKLDFTSQAAAFDHLFVFERELHGWDTFNALTMVGVSDGFLFSTATGPLPSITSSQNLGPFDGSVFDRLELTYCIKRVIGSESTVGKVQFITEDDSLWNDEKSVTFDLNQDQLIYTYILDLRAVKSWVGQIKNIKIFPALNSRKGDEFFFERIRLVSSRNVEASVNTDLVYGRRGWAKGAPVKDFSFDLTAADTGYIDVSLDGYGYERIDIPRAVYPSAGALRRAVEYSLGALNVGGYANAEVDYDSNSAQFTIRSGSFGKVSSVSLGYSRLAERLGFFTGSAASYSSASGEDPLEVRVEDQIIRIPTAYLYEMFKGGHTGFSLKDFRDVSVGDPSYATQSKRRTYGCAGDTLIDISHPALTDGWLDTVKFMGKISPNVGVKLTGATGSVSFSSYFYTNTANISSELFGVVSTDVLTITTSGYAGNGSYEFEIYDQERGILKLKGAALPPAANLLFEIKNTPKVKLMRPRSGNRLEVVAETPIGQQLGGLDYAPDTSAFSASVSWYVHRGDVLAIYNAQEIFVGSRSEMLDCNFVELDGEACGTVSVGSLKGNGVSGIGLYAYSTKSKKPVARIEVALETKASIAAVRADLSQGASYKRNINFLTALERGVTLAAVVSGTHVHNFLEPWQYPPKAEPNEAVNVDKLTDGILLSDNGVIGTYLHNHAEATYFYITGDGELTGPNLVEYSNPGPMGWVHDYISDYETDSYALNITMDLPKPLSRMKIYFKEFPNAASYFVEYFDGYNWQKIGKGQEAEFSEVRLDSTVIPASGILDTHLEKHFLPVFNLCPEIVGDDKDLIGLHLYTQRPYTVLEKSFTSVETNGFKWVCPCHRSTKISEFELYSEYQFQKKGLDIQVSVSGDRYSEYLIPVLTGDEIIYSVNSEVNSLSIDILATEDLQINSLTIVSDDDIEKVTQNGRMRDAIELGPSGTEQVIEITNDTGYRANLSLQVQDAEEGSTNYCLFNFTSSGAECSDAFLPEPEISKQPDSELLISKNVAVNARAWGLKNLLEGRPYYVGTCRDETDTFERAPDDRWSVSISNLPQLGPVTVSGRQYGNITVGSGIEIRAVGSSARYAPNGPVAYEADSTWTTVSEVFSAQVDLTYSLNNSQADALGGSLILADASGRRVELRHESAYYSESGKVYSFGRYAVAAGSSEAAQKTVMDRNWNAGTPFGKQGNDSPRSLKVTCNGGSLFLQYRDSVNGNGSFEWDGDDNVTITGLMPPYKLGVKVFWNPHLSVSGQMLDSAIGSSIPYVKAANFVFAGHSTLWPDLSFGVTPKMIGASGTTDELSGSDHKLVAIPLGGKEVLDFFQTASALSGCLPWDSALMQISRSEAPDAATAYRVREGSSFPQECRWLFLRALPSGVGGVRHLGKLRAYPVITQQDFHPISWEDLGYVLTDGDPQTALTQMEYPVVAVDLGETFHISNFSLLSRNGLEFGDGAWGRASASGFQGRPSYFSSTGAGSADIRSLRISAWVPYLEGNKKSSDARYLFFKNEGFEGTKIAGGREDECASLEVETYRGARVSRRLEDIDPTEYANWFQASSTYYVNASRISAEQTVYSGLLYGGADTVELQGSIGSEDADYTTKFSDLFDSYNTDLVDLVIEDGAAEVWRIFGNVTGTGTVIEPESKLVVGLDVDIDAKSVSKPSKIEVYTLSGADWTLWYTVSGLTSQTDDYEFSFNSGKELKYFFPEKIQASGIKIVFGDFQYEDASAFRLDLRKAICVAEESHPAPSGVVITNVSESGQTVLSCTVPATGEPVELSLGRAAVFDQLTGIDDNFDFQVDLKAEDWGRLDTDQSYLRLGIDRERYLQWKFSQGRFTEKDGYRRYLFNSLAASRPYIGTYRQTGDGVGAPEFDLNKEPLTLLSMGLKQKAGSASFTVKMNAPAVVPVKYSDLGLYLGTDEQCKINAVQSLNNMDFSMTLAPVWNSVGVLPISVNPSDNLFSIFSLKNVKNEGILLGYREVEGLELVFVDKAQSYRYILGQYPVIHGNNLITIRFSLKRVSLSDNVYRGEILIDGTSGSKFNVNLSFSSDVVPCLTVGYNFYGRAMAAVSPYNPIVSVVPAFRGLLGYLKNITLYTRRITDAETSFSQNTLLSLDGKSYRQATEGSELKALNIPPGGTIPVYVKSCFSEGQREGALNCRWEIIE